MHPFRAEAIFPAQRGLSAEGRRVFSQKTQGTGGNGLKINRFGGGGMSLTAERLTKKYGDFTAVNTVSFTLENGLHGLLGPNGAGKTTLMRLLVGALNATGGRVLCDGADIFGLDARYRDILGYLPQQFEMYGDFTGKNFLQYVADLKGIDRGAARRRIAECIEIVDMTGNENKKIHRLSGGMKRRIGIAQTLLNDPKILVLDEPTSGLDPSERIRLRNYLLDISKDRVVILSTHIVADLESSADTILMMKQGVLIENAPTVRLLHGMNGKVYTVSCDDAQAERLRSEYIVPAVQRIDGRNEVRIISDEVPSSDATQVMPKLEDVYMYHFGENGAA
jgi:ABC-type multidrug transport system ATPase subunit